MSEIYYLEQYQHAMEDFEHDPQRTEEENRLLLGGLGRSFLALCIALFPRAVRWTVRWTLIAALVFGVVGGVAYVVKVVL